MLPAMFAMLVILGLAVAVLATVVLGMEGTGRHRLPEVSHTLARAGRHLNGEASPPRGLVAFFDAAEDGADDLRHLPGTLRQLRSGSSARSARSAASAASVTPASAPTARSSATPAHPDAFVPRPFPDAPPPASAWGAAPGRPPAPAPAPRPQAQPAPSVPSAERPTVPAPNAWAVWSSDDRG